MLGAFLGGFGGGGSVFVSKRSNVVDGVSYRSRAVDELSSDPPEPSSPRRRMSL